LGFTLINGYLALSVGKFLFQTPIQGAQERNLSREREHQYVMALLLKGRDIQSGLKDRMEPAQKSVEKLKEIREQHRYDLEAELKKKRQQKEEGQ
jgi:hypothetical protein